MKDLKGFLEKYKTEDGYDFETANEALNEDINKIVAKNKPSEEVLLEKAQASLIEGLGIDAKSLDDVKTYIKKMGGNTDEFKEANLKLEKELNDYKSQFETLSNEKSTLEQQFRQRDEFDKIRSLGIDTDDKLEFVHFKVGKLVNDERDFDTALAEYKETNPDLFRNKEVSTGRRFRSSDSTGGDLDITEAASKKLNK